MEISSLRKLIDVLKVSNPTIVSVDGESLAGKSISSEILVQQLGYEYIDVDDCIGQGSGNYSIDINKLKIKVEAARGKKILIDGVLLLDILNELKLKPNVSIYVERCNKDGVWIHWSPHEDKWSTEEIYSKPKEKILEEYGDSPVKK